MGYMLQGSTVGKLELTKKIENKIVLFCEYILQT